MLPGEAQEDLNQIIQGGIAAFEYLCQEDHRDPDGPLLLFSESEQQKIISDSLDYEQQTKLKATAIKSALLNAWQTLLNGGFAELCRKNNIINPDTENENLQKIVDDYIFSQFIPKDIYKTLFDNQGDKALGRITLNHILFPALLCISSNQYNYEGILVNFSQTKNYPVEPTPKDFVDHIKSRVTEFQIESTKEQDINPYFASLEQEMDKQNFALAIEMSIAEERQHQNQILRQRRIAQQEAAAPHHRRPDQRAEGFAQRELDRRIENKHDKYIQLYKY